MADETVTRFAPSPTGALHIGGARTALLNWAFARQQGGRFVLRMEDTDRRRSSPELTRGILEDLRWLGLDWDQGPDPSADDPRSAQRGDRGPYFQSQRREIYREHLDRLLETGWAYVDSQGVGDTEEGGEASVVRFRMPAHPITVHDRVLGAVTVEPGQVEDFVVWKSDGFPTFHFAVVVDDATMGVTHVIRGQEHLNNTPKHWALQEALGFTHPTYAHIPLIFNPDGSKMSKRDKAKAAREAAEEAASEGRVSTDDLVQRVVKLNESAKLARTEWQRPDIGQDDVRRFLEKENDSLDVARLVANELNVSLPEIDVSDFRGNGYLEEVLCNYLALLGWNPGGDVEQFDKNFLVENFSLDRVQRANARFDREKLASFNADAIAHLPARELRRRIWEHPHNEPVLKMHFSGPDDPRFATFVEAYRERSRTLLDPVTQGRFFFTPDEHLPYDEKAVEKVLRKNEGEGMKVLRDLSHRLETCDDWTAETLESFIRGEAERRGVGLKKVAQPLRVAVSGGTVSPPIFQTLEVLGKASTLRRITHVLAREGFSDVARPS